VHPCAIDLLNRLVTRLGSTVTVVNSLLYLTKGDVCRVALGAGLHPDALYWTVSCGRSPMYRSSSALAHCGLCVACLFRRSGLLAALGSDHTPYERESVDVIDDGQEERGLPRAHPVARQTNHHRQPLGALRTMT
jgi:hypothetical protein